MRENQVRTAGWVEPGRCERRGRGDEAVDQYRDAPLRGGDGRAADGGDLEPPDGAKDLLGRCIGETVPRQRGIDDLGLARPARTVEAGSEPGQTLGTALQQGCPDRGRRGGVADSHFAEDDEV